MNTNYTCCFVIIIQDESYGECLGTIQSALQCINQISSSSRDNHRLVCVFNDESTDTFKKVSTIDDVETILWEPGQYYMGEPEIVAMLSTVIKNIYENIVILFDPISPIPTKGHRIDEKALSNFVKSLNKVDKDTKKLIISHDGKSSSLPKSAMFNSLATQFGFLTTAADGMPVSMKKSLFGSPSFSREEDFLDFPEFSVPWLIGAIAYEFSTDNYHRGLNLDIDLWTK
jgi:hypothetical protein